MTERLSENEMFPIDELLYQQEMDDLNRLLEVYAVDTGIPDLAQEHDHYLHGTPKRSNE